VSNTLLPAEPATGDEPPVVVRLHPAAPGEHSEHAAHAELVPGASLAEAVARLALY
jgi:hypothetical protein